MGNGNAATARAKRQERVEKVVWGLLLVTMGVLLTLHNLGRIDMGAASSFPPARAVDGKADTRWSSAFSDPQWITVDLGSPADVQRIKLNWEAAHATAYQLQMSQDGSSWTTLKEVTNGDGAIDEYEVSSNGRYVRMNGLKRATPYGYSLWEFEVYGTPGSARTAEAATPEAVTPEAVTPEAAEAAASALAPLSRGKAATASSMEGSSLWPLYWPVLLLASGLPSLLAPKDVCNQVVGFMLTASGVFFQLRTLGFHSWGLGETLPVVFIVAGLMLVARSWSRRSDETTPGGDAGNTGSVR
jgi:multisubunit Na+/H+ antiporter MnhC subunit